MTGERESGMAVRRKDGLLEMRVAMGEFGRRWSFAPAEDKLVLEDAGALRRPALWIDRDPKVRSVLTPYPAHWEEWARRQKRGGQTIGRRERQCRQCGAKLELSKELESMWTFWCPVCRSIEMQGKERVGGTHGAGEKEVGT